MITTQALPVKSSTERYYTCVLSSDPTSIHDATVVVHDTTGKRVKTTITRCYLITEEPGRSGYRTFLVVKDDHHTRSESKSAQRGIETVGDVYRCEIPTNGEAAKCTCYAGNTGKSCLHQEVLRDLVETGVLVSPQDRQHHTGQVEQPMTEAEGDEMVEAMARARASVESTLTMTPEEFDRHCDEIFGVRHQVPPAKTNSIPRPMCDGPDLDAF